MAGKTYKTEAIVLRSMRFSEADRILHLYTANRGRIGAIAKGVRKTKSRFGARLEPLSHVELMLHEGGGELQTITGVELLRSHHVTREDTYRLNVGMIGAEAMLRLFGEPEAKPMGYGRAPKTPSYNLQSVVDVESGLIVHHDVYNDANDSHLLHPMAVGTKEVLEVESLQVLTDGGYSNAEEIARCEREHIEVAAPIKRGAMNSDHFRPAQFVYDEVTSSGGLHVIDGFFHELSRYGR